MFNTSRIAKLERKIKAMEELLGLKKYTDFPSINEGAYFTLDNEDSWIMKLKYFNPWKAQDAFLALLDYLELDIKEVKTNNKMIITKKKKK